ITEDIDYSFTRFLRPTQSEMGDIDQAAVEEAKKNRCFLYTASNQSTCLVEADEEPPHHANKEAINTCLTIAILLNAKPIDEIHFMRKIVIDGSNTSGFQRTALIAINGKIDNVKIQTLELEEDAERKIKEKNKTVNYGLDRLGIPLIEIATSADIKNPEHARKTAEKIGLLLQSTKKVKKGLGTIRQDLNISIQGGARVEIKGIQSLSSISKVAENETKRQMGLIEIKKILKHRIKKGDLENIKHIDLTNTLRKSNSNIIKKLLKNNASCIKAIKLPGFHGLLKQRDTRLGRELAVYARISTDIGGIIHSDELPGYGINEKEKKEIEKILGNKENDAFVIAIGKETTVNNALQAVIKRAKMFLDGVPEEVRRALPDDTTEYMRPLPGAARMYPETDVPPIRITPHHIQWIKKHLPEKIEEKHKRFIKQYNLNEEQTKQIISSGQDDNFEKLAKQFPNLKKVILRTLLNTLPELEKEGIKTENIDNNMLNQVFYALEEEKYAKEAIPKILKYLAQHRQTTIDKAIEACGLKKLSQTEITQIIKKIVDEKKEFIAERGKDSLGPLMGIAMKELRGKADGKIISKILQKEIEKTIISS
ncbi:MAG: Glu-tRNA(Gln) amidotransferase GatDE subunit E, partial [Thermoplasmata archaeon]